MELNEETEIFGREEETDVEEEMRRTGADDAGVIGVDV